MFKTLTLRGRHCSPVIHRRILQAIQHRHTTSILIASPPRHQPLISRLLHTSPSNLSTKPISQEPVNMASDEDYMSFLNKANQDVSGGNAASTQSNKFKTTDSGSQVPKPIQSAIKDAVYVTDADEPFEGVSLKWSGSGGLPDEEEFAKLIGHSSPGKAEIEIMDPTDWDSQGQYGDVLDAVREASKGADVRVYRVKRDGSRTEYWVVSNAGGQIVGAKALGVES